MGEDDMKMMMGLLLNKKLSEPLTFEEFLKDEVIVSNGGKEAVPPALMAVWLRNVRLNDHFKMSIDAALFLSMFVTSFGDATLYYSYAASKAKELNSPITLSFLAEHVFPWGVFDQEQLSQMWALQKDGSSPNGNLLDSGEAWREYLYGGDVDKLKVRFSDEDERLLTLEEVAAMGEVKEPREIDGRMYFWLGRSYVNTTKEDYTKLQNK